MENSQFHLAAVLVVKKFNFYAAHSSHVWVSGRCLIMHCCEEVGAIYLLGILPTSFGSPKAASFTGQTSPVPHQRKAPTPEHLGWPPFNLKPFVSAMLGRPKIGCSASSCLPRAGTLQPKQSTGPHQLLDCFFLFVCPCGWQDLRQSVFIFAVLSSLCCFTHGKHQVNRNTASTDASRETWAVRKLLGNGDRCSQRFVWKDPRH